MSVGWLIYFVKIKDNNWKRGSRTYQDDGLGVFCSLSGPQVDRKQKQMEEPFRQCKLSITVEINLKNLNFVDVLFDLTIETFKRT